MEDFLPVMALCFTVISSVNSAYIQHEVLHESPEADEPQTEVLLFAPLAWNQHLQNVTTTPTASNLSKPSSMSCPICVYDFKSNRLNKGFSAFVQPSCAKGTLVVTSVGSNYEMCCCNFSSSDDWELPNQLHVLVHVRFLKRILIPFVSNPIIEVK